MARFRNFRCPDCGGVFRDLQVRSDDPPPDRCPLCGAWVSGDEPPAEVFVPAAPLIRKNALVKSEHQVYRAMEDASIARAAEAADMAGVPVSEMSHMKITNMREAGEMREGDQAAITRPSMPIPTPTYTPPPHMATAGFQNLGGNVPNYMPGVGPARSGEATRASIVSGHNQRAAAMIAAGNMGSYTPKG